MLQCRFMSDAIQVGGMQTASTSHTSARLSQAMAALRSVATGGVHKSGNCAGFPRENTDQWPGCPWTHSVEVYRSEIAALPCLALPSGESTALWGWYSQCHCYKWLHVQLSGQQCLLATVHLSYHNQANFMQADKACASIHRTTKEPN